MTTPHHALHGDALQPAAWAVDSIGCLVPARRFRAVVHSVFAGACNLALDAELLTLCIPGLGRGPTTMRLARDPARDLRQSFHPGERVECRDGLLHGARVQVSLRQATVWRPVPAGPRAPDALRDANLDFAAARLAARRAGSLNILDRQAAAVAAALHDACRALDQVQAERHAARLVGWGEGLTPAGDDFLVGLLAGLDAMVQHDPARRRLQRAVAARIAASVARTTPIAAHFLRLAAAGHFAETLCTARDALLGEMRREPVGVALDAALSIGATSGADTVSGLLAGLAAWSAMPARAILR
jgi:Protein of unknown function (DUF2877)